MSRDVCLGKTTLGRSKIFIAIDVPIAVSSVGATSGFDRAGTERVKHFSRSAAEPIVIRVNT
jgi:hypothetical protein